MVLNVMDLVAALLVLSSLVIGGLSLEGRRRKLKNERTDIQRTQMAGHLGQTDARTPTVADMGTIWQDNELTVLEYLRPSLTWPFALATFGSMVALTRAILALCGVDQG